eukprot:GAHX01002166.1.p1 GENE.GAHX01002166.1~~GAHX01002166.1.p1  ORF type:complete len:833 (-),score=137.72 GAHX01002166.1:30-2528(-)
MENKNDLTERSVTQTDQVAFYLCNMDVNISKDELYTSGLSTIHSWDLGTGKLKHNICIPLEDDDLWPSSTPSYILADNNTDTLYIGLHNGQVLIHSLLQSTTSTLNTHKSKITKIIQNKGFLFTTSLDRHISIFNISTLELQFYTELQEPIINASVDSKHFYVLLRTGVVQGFDLVSRKMDIMIDSHIEGENRILGIISYLDYLISFSKKEILFFKNTEIVHSINTKGLNIKNIKIYQPKDNKTKHRFLIQLGDRKLITTTIDKNLETEHQGVSFSKFFKKINELAVKYKVIDYYLRRDYLIVSTTGNRIYNFEINQEPSFEKKYVVGKGTHYSGITKVGFSETNNQEDTIKAPDVIYSVSKNLIIFRDSHLNLIQKIKIKNNVNSCLVVDNFCFIFDTKNTCFVYDLQKGTIIKQMMLKFEVLNVQKFSYFNMFRIKTTKLGLILFGKSNLLIMGYNKKNNEFETLLTRKLDKEITSGIYLSKHGWVALATIECKVELFKLEFNDGNTITIPSRPLFSMYGHSLPINTISTDVDETLLFTGSVDKSMKIFNLQFGDLVKTCIGHKEEITKIICFGEYLISSSRDRKIIIWSLNKFKLLKEIRTLHLGDVWDMDATPDMLITGCEDRSVRSIPYELLEDFVSIKEEIGIHIELEENVETNKFMRFKNVKTKISNSLKWKAVYLQNFIRSFYDEIVTFSPIFNECKEKTKNVNEEMTTTRTNNIAHYKSAMKIQQNDVLFNKVIDTWTFSELDELFRAESDDLKNKLFSSILYCYNENSANISLNYGFICKKYFENNKAPNNVKGKELLCHVNDYLGLLNDKLVKTLVLSEMA